MLLSHPEDALGEARLLHPGSAGYFSVLSKPAGGGRPSSKSYSMDKLDVAVGLLGRSPDSYLSQCNFIRPGRKISNLQSMSAAWVDIDCYKLTGQPKVSERFLKEILQKAAEMGIPRPSYAVSSGRGMYLKWIFDAPVMAGSLVTWDTLQSTLVAVFKSVGADSASRDAARVLRALGTTNSKVADQHSVQVMGDVGDRIGFMELCGAVAESRFCGRIPACRNDEDLAWGGEHEAGEAEHGFGITADTDGDTKLQGAGSVGAGRGARAAMGRAGQVAEPLAAVRAKQKLDEQLKIEAATSRSDLEGLVMHSEALEQRLSRPGSTPDGQRARRAWGMQDLSWKRFIDLRNLMIMRGGASPGQRDLYLFWMLAHLGLADAVNDFSFKDEVRNLSGLIDHNWTEPISDGSMGSLHARVQAHCRLARAGKLGKDCPTPIYTVPNSRLIDLFEITGEEMQAMVTIIDPAERQRRSDAKCDGRDDRREQRQKFRAAAARLLHLGSSVRQVARALGASLSQVTRVKDDPVAMAEIAEILVTPPSSASLSASTATSDTHSASSLKQAASAGAAQSVSPAATGLVSNATSVSLSASETVSPGPADASLSGESVSVIPSSIPTVIPKSKSKSRPVPKDPAAQLDLFPKQSSGQSSEASSGVSATSPQSAPTKEGSRVTHKEGTPTRGTLIQVTPADIDPDLRLTPRRRRQPVKLKGTLLEKIATALGRDKTSREACAALGVGESVMYRAKRALLNQGVLVSKGRELTAEELAAAEARAAEQAAALAAARKEVHAARAEATRLRAEARAAQERLRSSIGMQRLLDTLARVGKYSPAQLEMDLVPPVAPSPSSSPAPSPAGGVLAPVSEVAGPANPGTTRETTREKLGCSPEVLDSTRALINDALQGAKAAEARAAEAFDKLMEVVAATPEPTSRRYAPGHGPKLPKPSKSTKASKAESAAPAPAAPLSATAPAPQIFEHQGSRIVQPGNLEACTGGEPEGPEQCTPGASGAPGDAASTAQDATTDTIPTAPPSDTSGAQHMSLLDEPGAGSDPAQPKPSARSALDRQLANLAKAKAARDRLAAAGGATAATAGSGAPGAAPGSSRPPAAATAPPAASPSIPSTPTAPAPRPAAATATTAAAAATADAAAEAARQAEMRRRAAERLAAFQHAEALRGAADGADGADEAEPAWDDPSRPAGTAFSAEQWAQALNHGADGRGGQNIVFEMRNAVDSVLVVLPREAQKAKVGAAGTRAGVAEEAEEFLDPLMAMMFEGCLVLGPKAQCAHPSQVSGTMEVLDQKLGPWKYRIVRPLAHKEDRFYLFGAKGRIKFNLEDSVQAHVAAGSGAVIPEDPAAAESHESQDPADLQRPAAPRG